MRKHRDFVRFLWFRDLENLNCDNLNDSELAVYRICRVLFGVSSSPFLLSSTIIEYLNKLDDQNFTNKLLKSLYVDDLCSGGDTITEVVGFMTYRDKF